MARKESTFIAEAGRDNGKKFHITEMSASQAESWAIKTMLAVGNAGIEIPENLASQGMAGLLAVGYMNLLKIPFESAKPLLDEMMTCVKIVTDSGISRSLIEDDIEEVQTRLLLRKAIWNLHMDFFLGEDKSTLESKVPQKTANDTLTIKPRAKR